MPAPSLGSLAVIGGGVIGLSVARQAARAGWTVRVHRTAEFGASWVAGGMLAPHSEGWPGEEQQLRLGLRSLELWHDFLDGLPVELVTARESLVVAADRADVADLRRVADWLSAQGHPVFWESAARDVEPLLAAAFGTDSAPPPSWRSTTARWWARWSAPVRNSGCAGLRRCMTWPRWPPMTLW